LQVIRQGPTQTQIDPALHAFERDLPGTRVFAEQEAMAIAQQAAEAKRKSETRELEMNSLAMGGNLAITGMALRGLYRGVGRDEDDLQLVASSPPSQSKKASSLNRQSPNTSAGIPANNSKP